MTQAQPLKHVRLAWRATLPKYEQDEAFARLVAFVRAHAAVINEVALFDSAIHHVYIPLDVYEGRATLMAQRLRALKEVGVPGAGINVLATLGHINEAWDTMPPLPFQPMVGHDGSLSTGCACPNTPELRGYVRARYTLVAQAAPDFVWVDDDIRMQHHGVDFACFCPTCLRLFAEMTGERYTRESLVQALSDPVRDEVRRAWVEQNIRSIESLLAEVEAAVHAVNPAIATHLMTAGADWSTYSGVAFDRWVAALKGSMVRPAGSRVAEHRPGAAGAGDRARARAGVPRVTAGAGRRARAPARTIGRRVASDVGGYCAVGGGLPPVRTLNAKRARE